MRKISIILVTLCFVGAVFGVALVPQPAAALEGPGFFGKWVWEKIGIVVGATVNVLKTKMVTDAVDIFAQNLAYKTATSLATGGRGQQTLFEGRVFQNILKDAAGAAAGDFIGSLSDEWDDLGIDLCNPKLDVKVSITMSLLKFTTPQIREPKCDFAEVVKNWESFVGEKKCLFGGNDCSEDDVAAAQANLLEGLNVQFRPGKSDFAAQIALNDKILSKIDESKIIAQLEKLKSSFKPKKNVTGTMEETPTEMIEDVSKQPLQAAQATQSQKTQAALENPYAGILASALSTFTNTLGAKLLERWINDGMYKLNELKTPMPTSPFAIQDPWDDNPFDSPITQEAVEGYYSELVTTTFGTIEEYDPLTDFIICPTNADIRTVNNCVMNSKFYSAFDKAEAITVAQAINLRLLDPDAPLIPKESPWHSDLQFCYKEALCFSNLQKMRLNRLIPLGWEIAASISDPENPITLGEAIAAFEPSDDNPNSQFENLIDPEWLLVAPRAQCRAMGYGPELVSASVNTRGEICTDIQTCLQTNNSGECVSGAWGYCTREQNIWQLDGEQCPSVYASCRGYTNNNQTEYYIKDTLDFCDFSEVGCQWYGLSKEAGQIYDDISQPNSGNLCGFTLPELDLAAETLTANMYCQAQGYEGGEILAIGDGEELACFYNNEISDWDMVSQVDKINELRCYNSTAMVWDQEDKIYLNFEAGTCEGQNAGCTELIKIEPGVNLVYNGSFEIDSDNNNVPDGWSLNSSVERVDNTSHYGDYSIFANAAWDYAYQTVDIAPNTIYTISLYAKEYDGGLAVNLRFYNEAGTLIAPNDYSIDSGDTSWVKECGNNECYLKTFSDTNTIFKKYELEFVSRANSGSIRLSIGASNSVDDAIYIDGVQVEVGPLASTYIDYGTRNLSYIKKAPDYLDCLDDNSKWICDDYAPSCAADEFGCELYMPTNGDPAVPGIVAAGDYCSAECSGYEQYLQENTEIDKWFGDADQTLYYDFIANTAQSCNLVDVGCEEFTNITAGETIEYYKQLRMCVADDNPNTSTYYTWEGSETAGYELRVWKLLKSDEDGGPCTNVLYNGTTNVCNDAVVGIDVCADEDDPACRYYIDENNEEYLRRESKVIKASDQCVNLRRSVKGTDIAMVLTSESASCSATAAGCKVYRGNDGSNTRRVFVDDFEVGAGGWVGGSLSSEAVVSGGHSYKVISNNNIRKDVSLSPNKSYVISFWAKAANSVFSAPIINFDNGFEFNSNSNVVNILNEWRQFEFGPVYYHYDGAPDNYIETLTIDMNVISYYIDNIILKEINSDLYFIRNSWQTPSQCSAADLGCQEYKDLDSNIHYLHNFDSLCRESAVGCSMFIDTKNTKLPSEQAWSSGGNITVPADELIYLVDNSEYYCGANDKGCSALGLPGMGMNNEGGEEVVHWQDVYLINNPDQYELTLCDEEALGCGVYRSENGLTYFKDPGYKTCSYVDGFEFNGEEFTGWYITSTINDDDFLLSNDMVECNGTDDPTLPKRRDWIDGEPGFAGICNTTMAGCTEIVDSQATQGENYVRNEGFEDLFVIGDVSLPDFWCRYRNEILDSACQPRMKEGEGRDKSNAVLAGPEDNFYQFINTLSRNKLYSVAVDLKKNNEATNNDFFIELDCDGGIAPYDGSMVVNDDDKLKMIISSSDINYDYDYFLTYSGKFVVENGDVKDCKLSLGGDDYLIDNVRIKEVKSYYYFDNFQDRASGCSGQISWDEGCISVLDTSKVSIDTGEIIKNYNSGDSYRNSMVNNGGGSTPAIGCSSGEPGCDSNRIIKVARDRECAEWLDCRSSNKVTMEDGSTQEFCYQLGRCREVSPSGSCINWVTEDSQLLTDSIYKNRETGWFGNEYSGYSLLNRYNVDSLLTKTIDSTSSSGVILTNIEGDGIDGDKNNLAPSCRLFPEENSPFAITGLNTKKDDNGLYVGKPENMSQANFCQQGDVCECTYQKVEYNDGAVKYFGNDFAIVDREGIMSIGQYNGYWGFCLEPDYSRLLPGYVDNNYIENRNNTGLGYACLTWLPLDILRGEYNPSMTAGALNYDLDNLYYCMQSEGNYVDLDDVENIVINSSFDSDISSWVAQSSSGNGAGCVSYDSSGSVKLTVDPWGTCTASQNINTINLDYKYRLSFNAKITEPQDDGSLRGYLKCLYDSNSDGNADHSYDYTVDLDIGVDRVGEIQYGYDVFDLNEHSEGDELISCSVYLETSTPPGVNNGFCAKNPAVPCDTVFECNNYKGFCANNYCTEIVDDRVKCCSTEPDVTCYSSDTCPVLGGACTPDLDGVDKTSILFDNVILTAVYDSEICTEFVQVASPKYNAILVEKAKPGEFFVPASQYYDVYGSSKIVGDIVGHSAIQVEPSVGSVSSVAGTPYSIKAGGNINIASQCYAWSPDSTTNVCEKKSALECTDNSTCSIPTSGTCVDVKQGFCSVFSSNAFSPCWSASDCEGAAIGWLNFFPSCWYWDSVNSVMQTVDTTDDGFDERGYCTNDLISTPSCLTDSDCENRLTHYGSCVPKSSITLKYDCTMADEREICYAEGGHCFGLDATSPSNVSGHLEDKKRILSNAYDFIKQLYARIIKRFTWDGSAYNTASISGSSCFDKCDITGNGEKVKVRQVNPDGGESLSKGITVMGQNSGDIERSGEHLNTTIKFYAYNETGNQIPIKRVVVDWGDDNFNIYDSGEVSAKNHQGRCDNSCEYSIFGEIKDGIDIGWSSDNYKVNLTRPATRFLPGKIGEPSDDGMVSDYTEQQVSGTTEWEAQRVQLIRKPSSGPRQNYISLYVPWSVMEEKGRFEAGEYVTLEYDYCIPPIDGGSQMSRPITNGICYDSNYCSQAADGIFSLPGQTNSFPTLSFADTERTEAGGDCSDSENGELYWKHYKSTIQIPKNMISGCYWSENQSGYCLRELYAPKIGDNTNLLSEESIFINNVKLKSGCRFDNDCRFTKFGDNLGECIAADIGDDPRYCIDNSAGGIGYFSFSHTYICDDEGEIVPPDTRTDACVYQPRVYVEDNWGWCSKGYKEQCFEDNVILDSAYEVYVGKIILTP